MKVFVLITAVLELMVGFLMLVAPKLFPDLAAANEGSIGLARMYGGAALGLGFFAFQTWQHFQSEIIRKAFLQTFILFHLGVAIAAFMGYTSGGWANPSISILHFVLALVTIYFFVKRKS